VQQDSEKRVAKQIPTLVEAIEKYLHRLEDVDEDMPINCTLEKFSGSKTATLKTLVFYPAAHRTTHTHMYTRTHTHTRMSTGVTLETQSLTYWPY
jgi:hypothetical protein